MLILIFYLLYLIFEDAHFFTLKEGHCIEKKLLFLNFLFVIYKSSNFQWLFPSWAFCGWYSWNRVRFYLKWQAEDYSYHDALEH